MITEKLQNAINDQIIAEMWSANLYLSMSFYHSLRKSSSMLTAWLPSSRREAVQPKSA